MNKVLNCAESDDLYYSDFVYAIKKMANLPVEVDEKVEKRIEIRCNMVKKFVNDTCVYEISDFQYDLFFFARNISKIMGVIFHSPNEIAKYPELVTEQLKEYEKQKNKNMSKKRKK